jgi:uncharacterized membrane protein (UPF0182 family)
MAETLDWPPPRRRRRRLLFAVAAALVLVLLGGGTTISYYVDALWFNSLGYVDVFWRTLRLQSVIFTTFFLATFVVLYGSFALMKPVRFGELPILINGQPLRLPVEPVLRLIAMVGALFIAIATGAGMMAEWPLLAAWWYAPPAAGPGDPIFGRAPVFYLFTLPAWQTVSGWALTLAVIVGAIAVFFIVVSGGTRLIARGRIAPGNGGPAWRGLSLAFAVAMLMLAFRVYLGRFERLFDDHTVFAGVTYTDAHVSLTGSLIIAVALAIGALGGLAAAAVRPQLRWLVASLVPAAVCYALVAVVGWYVSNFIV